MTCVHCKPKKRNEAERRKFREQVKNYRDLLYDIFRAKTESGFDYHGTRNAIKENFVGITHEDWKDYLLIIFNVLGRPCEIPDDVGATIHMNMIYQEQTYILADEIGMK